MTELFAESALTRYEAYAKFFAAHRSQINLMKLNLSPSFASESISFEVKPVLETEKISRRIILCRKSVCKRSIVNSWATNVVDVFKKLEKSHAGSPTEINLVVSDRAIGDLL